MNIVPIAFAFDNNLVMPASVCISSLMMNAKPDTFYDVFILHSAKINLDKSDLNRLPEFYKNCRVQYREVDDTFKDAFEIRGITTAAYYRLLIPELIPEYDKIIYSDVDIIFRMDLAELYCSDIGDNYLAATHDIGLNMSEDGISYIRSVDGLVAGSYLQSGFIVMNSDLVRQDNLTGRFKELAQRKLKFQDQDILNVACEGKVYFLPMAYNMTNYSYEFALKHREMLCAKFADYQIDDAMKNGNIHFNGAKPWKSYCVNFDIWWEYYRKCPFFDEKFYFDFFYNKLDELDQLPLLKRIKILARYFVDGRVKH